MKKVKFCLLLLFAFLFMFSFASAVQVRVQSDATHDAVYRSNCELQGTSYVTAMDGVCVGGEDVVLDLDPGQHIIRAYMDRGHAHPTGGIAIKITNLEGELEYRTDVDVSSDSLTTNPYWRACHGDNYCNLFNKPTIGTFYNYGMVDIYEDNPVLISGADTVHYLADTRLNFISYIFTIPEEEIPEEVYQCSNSLDDDSDGLIDSADPGCWDDPMDSSSYNPTDDDENICFGDSSPVNEVCDGIDNDCNGLIDENDVCVSLRWVDMDGNVITEADKGDMVRMFASSLSSGDFSIFENDLLPFSDDFISSISGEESNGNLVGSWFISQADLDKTPNDFDEFYFEVEGDESDYLDIDPKYNDTPMNITITSPFCGQYFDEGDVVSISVDASDPDDLIEGTVRINGYSQDFSNGGVSFDYTLDKPGNSQIIAEAVNSRGKMARHIANIMVLDKQGVNYVNGETYLAACIDKPKDFTNFNGSLVKFDASTTRAVEIVDGQPDVISPESSPTRFSWYWRFLPEDIVRNVIRSNSESAYRFNADLPISGRNSASLRVEFD